MKRFVASIVMICMLTLGFTGCGAPSAQETAEAFMTALQDGEMAKVSELCDIEEFKYDFKTWDEISTLKEGFLETYKISESDLSEESWNYFTDLCDFLIQGWIVSYEMAEIDETDETGSDTVKADVKITFGYSYSDASEAISNSFGDEINAYSDEHPDEIDRIKDAEDEEYISLAKDLLESILQKACGKAKETLSAAEDYEKEYALTLTKGDDGWKVTGIGFGGEMGEIMDVVAQFLDSFSSGDKDGLEEFSTTHALDGSEVALSLIKKYKDDELELYKTEEVFRNYEAGEGTLDAIDQVISAMMSSWVKEYEITDVEMKEDGKAEVKVNVKGKDIDYSFMQYIEGLSATACRNALEESAEDVAKEIQNMGEEAFYKEYFDQVLPYYYQALAKSLDTLDDESSIMYLDVVNKDGKWLVNWVRCY